MKNFRKTIPVILATGLLGCGLLCPQAQARPIQGTIDFNGVVTFDTMSLATATKVMQWNSSFVTQDSGDFAGIAQFTNATMAPSWTFNLGTPAMPMPGPATPALWSVGGFTFDLTSSLVASQSATFLNVTGVGTISSTNPNLNQTPGTWSFTSSNANGQDKNTFSFQAESSAVPEASSVSLTAIGGVGLLLSRLLRRQSKVA
jgi:hypothetical protein